MSDYFKSTMAMLSESLRAKEINTEQVLAAKGIEDEENQ